MINDGFTERSITNELLGILDSGVAPEPVKRMLKLSRGHLEAFTVGQKSLIKNLKSDSRLSGRVTRL